MQSLADLYTQPFVVIGPDLRVRMVNRAFEGRYGVARESRFAESEAAGRRAIELEPGHPRAAQARALLERLP